MANIEVTDDAAWHKLRNSHVGSSDIACLLGLSKFKTRWQLWSEKTGQLPALDLDNVSHVRNGKHFEPAIAAIGAEAFGIKVRKVHRYIECDDCPDLGVSLDYEETGSGSRCPVEIKWSVFGQGWEYDGDTVLVAPDQYLIQVQAQLACMPSAPYARLWGFINGEVRQMILEPRPSIIDAIKATAKEFMDSVRAGVEPPVDFSLDGDALDRLLYSRDRISLDWSTDAEAETLMEAYKMAAADETLASKAKEWASNRLKKKMIDACADATTGEKKAIAKTQSWKMTTSLVAANPGHIIQQEEVGTVTGARAGHIRMTITELKEPKDAA